MSSLLLSERPLVVLPSLVKRVGLTRAIILQQIHWLLQQPRSGRVIDGRKWVWGDYDKWRELYFPFWSRRTLQRHILRLEEEGFLISAQHNVLNWDRTKYYRLNYERLNAALSHAGIGAGTGARMDAAAWEAADGDAAFEDAPDGEHGGAAGAVSEAENPAPPVMPSRAVRAGHRNGSAANAGTQNSTTGALTPAAPPLAAPMSAAPMPAALTPAALTPAALTPAPAEPQAAPAAASHPTPAAPAAPAAAATPTPAPTLPPLPTFPRPASAPAREPIKTYPAPPADAPRPVLRRPSPADAPAPRTKQEADELLHAVLFGAKSVGEAMPPAIRAFWEVHGRLPNTAQRRMIEDAEITDDALWRRCLNTWAARGYNPMRIDGPLEWYADPALMDARREGRTAAPPPAPAGPLVLDVSPEIAALLAGKA